MPCHQYIVHNTDGSVTKYQSGWGFTVKQGANTIHEDSAAYTVLTSNHLDYGGGSSHPRWIASRDDSQNTHAIILRDSLSLLQKVEWEGQTGMSQWSASTFENSCGCTALDMPEWRETTEQIDWREKQPTQVACFSEDLKRWEGWDHTCGHKAKDITQSISWRKEAWKEEGLDDLPLIGRERAIVRPTNIGKHFKGNVREASERRGWAHTGFSEHTDTILNWTELRKGFENNEGDTGRLTVTLSRTRVADLNAFNGQGWLTLTLLTDKGGWPLEKRTTALRNSLKEM